MQPPLQRERGLIVQQPRDPVLVAKNQLAREKDAVGILALDLLGKLDQLVDAVGPQRKPRCGCEPVGMAVVDIEGQRPVENRLEMLDLLSAAIALRIDRLGADENETIAVVVERELE